jgi:hypothetical protein
LVCGGVYHADAGTFNIEELFMTKDEALAFDLALEALESERPYLGPMPSKTVKAITAIKQARALDKMADNARELGLDYESADGTQVSKVWWDGEKLMSKPIPLEDFYQPVQEPVAWMEMVTANLVREGVGKHKARELAEHFYSLAQRPFVGLTDEEIEKVWQRTQANDFHDCVQPFAQAIEAKLREKNT